MTIIPTMVRSVAWLEALVIIRYPIPVLVRTISAKINPRNANPGPDPDAGHDTRQCARQNDLPQHLKPATTQGSDGVDQNAWCAANRDGRVEQHREGDDVCQG